jgi:hypothetical protein
MSQITIYTYYVKETNTKFNVKKISLEKIIEKFMIIMKQLFLKIRDTTIENLFIKNKQLKN